MSAQADSAGARIDVGIGGLAIRQSPDILVTSALGSCVAVALWDPFSLCGGLLHVMLPRPEDTSHVESLLRFASSGVPLLVDGLAGKGAPRRRLVAKIAGGASMFATAMASTDIGERNVAEVRRQLDGLRIPVEAADTGGEHARSVEFRLDSGTVVVRSYAYGVREL
jgi:chemotaxis protein CheD